MPAAVSGSRLPAPSHSCGRQACAWRVRARWYRSRLRAVWWPIRTIRSLPPLPRTVISRCHRSMSLHRRAASSESRMPVAREYRDDRGIAALREAAARTGMVQPGQLLAGEDGDQLVGDARRLQPGHRVGQLVFGGQPLEELLQGAVLVARVRGAVAA